MVCRPWLPLHVAPSECFLRLAKSSCQARRTSAVKSLYNLEQNQAQQQRPDCTSGTPVCHECREQRAMLTMAHNALCCVYLSSAAAAASAPPHRRGCRGRLTAPSAAGAMILGHRGPWSPSRMWKDVTKCHADCAGRHELMPGDGRMAAARRLLGGSASSATASCSRVLKRQGIASGGSAVRCIRRRGAWLAYGPLICRSSCQCHGRFTCAK